ncbi:regucalcin isoform X1 [Diabrotica virgifera virgifera]|uniref:Regucalcin n=1 Tax=Diabrotica virgifera virgifera TaxID=50390 RepID=A0ABM5KB31_DIAVI|nr:regucalcin isoform X1 [Diabrotica virgifera virgifera]
MDMDKKKGRSICATINCEISVSNCSYSFFRFPKDKASEVKITKLITPIHHGEGPYWCPESKVLLYTDTFKATLYKLKTDREIQISPECFKLPNHDTVGFALPIKDKKDTWVVCGDRHMYELKWPEKGKLQFKQIHTIEKDKPKNQFNDGKADNQGRIWGGTLKREADLSVPEFGGSLYMFDHELREHEKVPNVSISNGLAWSKDNTKFFFIDSATRDIEKWDYDAETGEISNKKIVINIKEDGYSGIPDGMTIDEDDNLWIALFGGHEVIQVETKYGRILRNIRIPATYVTSVAWGGPNFDILYVTTSQAHLDEKQLRDEPDAGCVFEVRGLGVKGIPPNQAIIKKSC